MNLEITQSIHRITGFIVVIFVLLLATTGILINHSDDLRLNKIYLDNDWLLAWYDIEPSHPPRTFRIGTNWLTQLDNKLYFNDQELPEKSNYLYGVAKLENVSIVVIKDELLLLTEQGDLIEKLTNVDGVPADITSIGVLGNNRFIVKSERGYYASDEDVQEWEPSDPGLANWSVAASIPNDLSDLIMQKYRGKGLSMERVMYDLHSGRIFGKWVKIAVDIVALLLIFSTITGVWSWYKKKKLLQEFL